MAFGENVEVSCSECGRRYAVADHKVAGRRRQATCRCGRVLIFDGRHLKFEQLSAAEAADSNTHGPEAALRHSEPIAENERAAPPSEVRRDNPAQGGPSTSTMSTPQMIVQQPPGNGSGVETGKPDSGRTIGRINLRRGPGHQAASTSSDLAGAVDRPTPSARAPRAHDTSGPPSVHAGAQLSSAERSSTARSTRSPAQASARAHQAQVGHAPRAVTVPPRPRPLLVAEAPEPTNSGELPVGGAPTNGSGAGAGQAPAALHEAFDTLANNLDRIADRIRPGWEVTPHSKRVTLPGDDPEVIVYYPEEWQPPPSARRRMLESSETPGEPPVSSSHQPATDSIDAGWAEDEAESVIPASAEFELGDQSAFSGGEARVPAETHAAAADSAPVPLTRVSSKSSLRSGTAPSPSSRPAAPRVREDAEPPRGERRLATSDSTAPTARSQPPPSAEQRSRSGLLAAAGLAAAALIGVLWRSGQLESQDGRSAAAHSEVAPPPRTPDTVQAITSEGVDQSPALAPSDSNEARAEADQSTRSEAEGEGEAARAAESDSHVPPRQPTEARPVSDVQAGVSREARTPDATSAPPSTTTRTPVRAAAEKPARAANSDVTDSEEVVEKPPEPRATLDPAQLRASLAAASVRARKCGREGEPSGPGSVRIILNPAGGVLNATVTSARFAGSGVKNCVEAAFKSASTSPYQGGSLSSVVSFDVAAK